jgi:two-component system sensor histidine kinase TctE
LLADNGPGIPALLCAAVFAPFHRLSGEVEGARLGLTIVQRIAHLHGAVMNQETGEGGAGLVVSASIQNKKPRQLARFFFGLV